MRLNDPQSHFAYVRMSKQQFDLLLSYVEPLLARRHYFSRNRAEVTPAKQLVVTLRYLATGNSQVSLSFNFRLGRSTVCNIVRETSQAIWTALQPIYIQAPTTVSDWTAISSKFQELWNFPNCLGAIDGKHIVIQAPANSGSTFYNYKGSHSIVLLAVCDALYRFTLVDVGDSGCHSDGGVLFNSTFGKALDDGRLNFPSDCPLPGTSSPILPHVIVGDEVFPLKKYLMRPFPGRFLPENLAVYNYRLSRARRIIENSFGILAAQWRIFRRPIIAHRGNVTWFTKAAIALHNFLRTLEPSSYCPSGFVDNEDRDGNVISGSWRTEEDNTGMQPIHQAGSNNHTHTAANIQEEYMKYFNSSNGAVSWQYQHVRRTS